MFFDDLEKIENLAEKTGFSIFVLPKISESMIKVNDQNHFVVTPHENQIKIEKIREIIEKSQTKRTQPFFIYVYNAELMNEKAENAFLKLLEEPADNYHYVLITNSHSALLPTILSRGDLYIQRVKNVLNQPVEAPDNIKTYAKQIISAKESELASIINKITNDKNYKKNSRPFSLQICEAAIEICYKSFFATENPVFLKKMPKLLLAYDNLKQNGHIKLHLVADLC